MNAVTTTAAALGTRARADALTKMGRLFKCSPQKAAERMSRPAANYQEYRVAFINLVDAAITNVFAHVDNGHLVIKTPHWAAFTGSPDSYVESNPLGRLQGVAVSYWAPKKDAA